MPRSVGTKKQQTELGDMTIAQLRAHAKKAHINLPKMSKTKPAILNAIEQSRGSMPAYLTPSFKSPISVETRGKTTITALMKSSSDTKTRRRASSTRSSKAVLSRKKTKTKIPPSSSLVLTGTSPAVAIPPPYIYGDRPIFEQSSTVSYQPVYSSVPVTVVMERSATEPDKIKIDMLAPSGNGYLTRLHYAATKAGTKMVIDTKCAPITGDVYAVTGKTSAILQQCEIVPGDDTASLDCNSKILYVEILPKALVGSWSSRLNSYANLHNVPLLNKNVLPVLASWLCDSSKFQYDVGGAWFGSLWTSKLRGESTTAFCTAEIPKGYQLWTLRDFMRSYTDPSKSSLMGLRTLYNVASTSWSWRIVENRYVESGMLDLTKKMLDVAIVPNQTTPESYGVLVKMDKNVKGDDVIPVLLPVPLEIVRGPPPKSVVCDALLQAIRSKIFDSVVSGFTADGASSVYSPSKNILRKIGWTLGAAVAIGGIAYTGASLLSYMGFMPEIGSAILPGGDFTTVNKFVGDAYATVINKSSQIGANAQESVNKVFNIAGGGAALSTSPIGQATSQTLIGPINYSGPKVDNDLLRRLLYSGQPIPLPGVGVLPEFLDATSLPHL